MHRRPLPGRPPPPGTRRLDRAPPTRLNPPDGRSRRHSQSGRSRPLPAPGRGPRLLTAGPLVSGAHCPLGGHRGSNPTRSLASVRRRKLNFPPPAARGRVTSARSNKSKNRKFDYNNGQLLEKRDCEISLFQTTYLAPRLVATVP